MAASPDHPSKRKRKNIVVMTGAAAAAAAAAAYSVQDARVPQQQQQQQRTRSVQDARVQQLRPTWRYSPDLLSVEESTWDCHHEHPPGVIRRRYSPSSLALFARRNSPSSREGENIV